MTKIEIVIQKPRESMPTNLTAIITEDTGQYYLTLLDENFLKIDDYKDVYIDSLINTVANYLNAQVGIVQDIYEIPNNPEISRQINAIRPVFKK